MAAAKSCPALPPIPRPTTRVELWGGRRLGRDFSLKAAGIFQTLAQRSRGAKVIRGALQLYRARNQELAAKSRRSRKKEVGAPTTIVRTPMKMVGAPIKFVGTPMKFVGTPRLKSERLFAAMTPNGRAIQIFSAKSRRAPEPNRVRPELLE